MTDTQAKTYKFDSSLHWTYLNPRYLAKNEKGGRYYARLAKGEDTLVEKDQSEFAEPYRLFVDGELKTITDKTEQEWIENHPDFKKRITSYDPAQTHTDNLNLMIGTSNTMQRIFALGESEIRGVGYRKFGTKALSQNINELKGMFVALANEDYQALDALLDEETETDFALVGIAMAKDIIYEAKGGNEVRFVDTDEVITPVRANERPIDAMASFLQTGAGKEIKKIIFQKLQPIVVEEIVEKKTTTKAK